VDKPRGFTLIELLVVISVIALLISILIPALQRANKHAKAVVCQAHLKQMGITFTMYAHDNNGYFHKEVGSDPNNSWVAAMRPFYGREPEIRVCPMTTKYFSDGLTGPFVGWGVYGEGILPNVPDWALRGDYGSFGLNGWIANDNKGFHHGKNWLTLDVKGGNFIPVFVDCQWVDALPEVWDNAPEYDGQCNWEWHNDAMFNFCINRHNGRVNGVFMDGTVRTIGLKELWTMKWHRNWSEDLFVAGMPVWPEWMKNFEEY